MAVPTDPPSYNWSVPTGQGRIIEPSTGAAVIYEGNTASNTPTNVTITCNTRTGAGNRATLTSLADGGTTGILLNIHATARSGSIKFIESNILTGSDNELSIDNNIVRLRWITSSRELQITKSSSHINLAQWWGTHGSNLSFYIVQNNGIIVEIPGTRVVQARSDGSTLIAILSTTEDSNAITALNGISAGHTIIFGIADSNSPARQGDTASDTHTIQVLPNPAPVVTLNIPHRAQVSQEIDLIANIEDIFDETIQSALWTSSLGTITNQVLSTHPTVANAYRATATLQTETTEGTTTVRCTARDTSNNDGYAESTIVIHPPNTAPQITFPTDTPSINPARVNQGETVNVGIEITDNTDDTHTITWESKPTTAPDTDYASDNFIPPDALRAEFAAPNLTGTYIIRVTVTDSWGLTATATRSIEVVTRTEGIQQFFTDPTLPNQEEWTNANQLFSNIRFQPDRNTSTQPVWIRNSTEQEVEITIAANHTGGIGSVNNQRIDWIRFDFNNGGAFTDRSLSFTLAAGAQRQYYIKITIPEEQLEAANAGRVFPVSGLEINVSITEPTNHVLRTRFEGDFNEGTYGTNPSHDQLEYRGGALRRVVRRLETDRDTPITPTSVSWTRSFDIHEITGGNALGAYRIRSLTTQQTVPNESNGEEITTSVRYIIAREDNTHRPIRRDIVQFNSSDPVITRPDDSTIIDFDLPEATADTHPHIRLTITLNDSTEVEGIRPDSERTSVQYANIYLDTETITTKTFRSYIQTQLLSGSQLPDGIIILNKENIPTLVPNNMTESFKFGYDRAGGNGNFTLKLNADWDEDIDIGYDYTVLFVQESTIQYRGIIDRIRTQLTTPEYIEISGAGISKQLSSIQVTHKFTHETAQEMLSTLFDKYLSDENTPIIYYNPNNIDNLNTTTSFDFKNESLFDVISKIAGAAGANPTGRGDTGTDIIWGVDENSDFYFLRKLNKLRYQFHTGTNITFDDAKAAPNFNTVIFIGDPDGYVLQNYVLDGECELTDGTIDPDFTDAWRVSPGTVVTPVGAGEGELEHVIEGSQAYKVTLFTDSTEEHASLRTIPHTIPNNQEWHLSFWAKASTGPQAPAITISVIFDGTSDELRIEDARITLTNEYKKYDLYPFTAPTKTSENATTQAVVRFTATEDYEGQHMFIDAIYLHRLSANHPRPENDFRRHVAPAPIAIFTTSPTNHEIISKETIEDRKYRREVFSTTKNYRITITDLTGVENFGRKKEVIQEVDSISSLTEAYTYGRALLGHNANETRRSSLNVTNNKILLKPYENNEIKWGYTQIFGSDNPETQYEYAIASVEHEWANDQINSNITLGAPRATVSELIRQLTARDRYRGE